VTLLAFAAERRAAATLLLGTSRPPLSIDISRPPGPQEQTRRTPRLWRNMGHTDRRTDRRTLYIYPAAYHASSVNNMGRHSIKHAIICDQNVDLF